MDKIIDKARKVIDIELEAIQLLRENLDEQFCGAVSQLKSTLDNG